MFICGGFFLACARCEHLPSRKEKNPTSVLLHDLTKNRQAEEGKYIIKGGEKFTHATGTI
jgi:hypothetical protein